MASEYLTRSEEIVEGVYPLGALIRRSAGSALYETEVREGEGPVPAVIRIRDVEPAEAENLTQKLRNAALLAHPNLLKIYASGTSTLNGALVFYVVTERADESLEAVLAERALTESETRELLVPALGALDYLHKKDYAHSRLRPSNVLAVNDQLKLSGDSVIRATGDAAAEDMRALGVLIVQALTGKTPREGWESQDFEAIPQPLADIVRHCLDSDSARRWTAEQVKARLNAPAIVEEDIQSSAEDSDAAGAGTGVPKWIYAGLAALILAVVLVAVARRNDAVPVASPSAAAIQHDAQVRATEPPVAESAPRPEVSQVTAPPVTGSPVTTRQTGSGLSERKASGWSVIVGAYGAREPAEKRMREMAKKWPGFKISVIAPQGEKTAYLVVLGRNLSEDQAQALRERAVDSGLPRDTYIKRLM